MMMTNLFSTFDPCTGMMSMNWMSMTMIMTIMPKKYWTVSNKNNIWTEMMWNSIYKEMKSMTKYKETMIMPITMFMIIITNNMMGMLPYIYTSTSQMNFSLSMALPMWTSMMMFSWINKTNKMFTHLVPMNTPKILMPMMVIIETTSNLIRPISLAVRLTANMIAGHLLMSLLGSNTSIKTLSLSMIVMLTMMIFEISVAMIQAYVFTTLTTLYSSET